MLLKHTHRLAPRRRARKAVSCTSVRARETTYLHSPSIVSSPDAAAFPWPSTPAVISPLKPKLADNTHSPSCSCRKPGLTAFFSICRFVPRQRFGNSMLPTPLVVLLRLIMPAAPLSLTCEHASRHDSAVRDPIERASAVGARLSSSYLRPRRLRREREMATTSSEGDVEVFAHLGRRVKVEEFLSEVDKIGDYASWKVVSITWVKALASHMSHEFVQFVVEDTRSGMKRRLIADRQETGDWVSLTPTDGPLEMSDTFKGLGSDSLGMGWTGEGKTTPYKDRHMLPLPLISVFFNKGNEGPMLSEMAELLAQVSARCKEYNPLREHCWWFSEAVLHGARMRWGQHARLKEWAWARYRYSFVICNRWVRRPVLESAARKFERKCLEELAY